MNGVNKAIIVGSLGADPETSSMPNGTAVTKISVATSEKWNKDGEDHERTEWHRVVFFNKLAEIAGKYLKKGSKVYVEGQLETRKWQDQSGNDRYSTEVVLRPYRSELVLLGEKQGNDSQGRDDHRNGAPAGGAGLPDEEIPFMSEWRV